MKLPALGIGLACMLCASAAQAWVDQTTQQKLATFRFHSFPTPDSGTAAPRSPRKPLARPCS